MTCHNDRGFLCHRESRLFPACKQETTTYCSTACFFVSRVTQRHLLWYESYTDHRIAGIKGACDWGKTKLIHTCTVLAACWWRRQGSCPSLALLQWSKPPIIISSPSIPVWGQVGALPQLEELHLELWLVDQTHGGYLFYLPPLALPPSLTRLTSFTLQVRALQLTVTPVCGMHVYIRVSCSSRPCTVLVLCFINIQHPTISCDGTAVCACRRLGHERRRTRMGC